MGVVYAARQVSLDRQVAIKILAPHLVDDPNFVARFRREAAIMSRLAHPHIVSVFEQGEVDGMSYIVMEYVEGDAGAPASSLRDVIDRNPLDIEQARRLMLQVAEALESAHEAAIVHRDLKPGNILVDARGDARIVDFGIASVADAEVGGQLTLTDSAIGTPDYMAPEQWKDPRGTDARSDIYAAGVILYELLTGRLPQATRFRPPSELVQGLPPGWDRIIEEALEVEADRRTPTMTRLVLQLQQASVELQSADGFSELHCARCNGSIDVEDQFCRGCHVVLWVECPACGTRTSAQAAACHQCRARVDRVVVFRQCIESGDQAMAAAESGTNAEERLQLALRAEESFSEALRYETDNAVIDRRDRCRTLIGGLALEVARGVFDGGQLAAARQLFELAGKHGQFGDSADKLSEIDAARDQFLSDARRMAGRSRLRAAIGRLRDGQIAFPDDREIAELLEQLRARSDRVASIVYHKIPALASRKQFRAVEQLIGEIRDSGVRLAGVERMGESIARRMEKIEPAVRAARECLERGRYVEAARRALRVLKHVSDDVEARRIADEAEERNEHLARTIEEIDTAIEQGRWYLVRSSLGTLLDHERDLERFRDAEQQLQDAMSGSRAATRLTLVAVVGGVVSLVSLALVDLAGRGIAGPLAAMDLDPTMFTALSQLVEIAVPLVATAVVIGLLAARSPGEMGWNGLVGGVIALVGAGLVTSIEPALSDWMALSAGRIGPSWAPLWVGEQLPLMIAAIPVGLTGATIGLLVTVPLVRLLPEHGWASCCWVAGTGLVISIALAGLSDRLPDVLEPVVAALVLTGALALSGLSTGWGRVLLVPTTGVLAGLLFRRVDIETFLHLPHAATWVTALLLAVAGLLISRPFRPITFIRVACLACLVVVLVHSLPTRVDPVSMRTRLALWCMVCGSLAGVTSGQLDYQLHLFDRVRTAWRRRRGGHR